MTFTEEDAQNDGLIKREVGREMAKVAQTQSPEMYEHFVRVCEEVGREPQDVFGEMAVRSLNSEEYANRVFNSEVSMKQLKADEIRVEDVQYVQQLAESLGMNEQQESNDPIDQLIEQRLQSITRSPIPRLRNQQNAESRGEGQMMEYMERLDERLQSMEESVSEGSGGGSKPSPDTGSSDQTIDDLFSDGDGDEPEPEEPVIESGTEVEPDVESHEEEEIPEGAVDEAMEGVGSVDDTAGPMNAEPDNPFADVGEEVEVENRGHDEEAEETSPAFSSSEADEE